MVFESENGHRIANPTKQNVFVGLSNLNGVRNSYSVLEDASGNYIQVGGGPSEFTVEVREIALDGTFKHWKAEYFSSRTGEKRAIIISGSSVQVESTQVLQAETVRQLFEAFMDGEYLSKMVRWIDITEMF
ncbi:Hypothetical protein LUCI_5208 [Lucifera butyrica]|uniref:Uncharacterized protein n=1 Tax=Lucifera butyrica TaxID=1351585 RepID=A0A498RGI0_9FIRM|nr:hypothetical protein [Lucifera butyrica]VBB09910.1 Hypothetical protein LUCI_5208 [Lucifera butyrica]